MIKYTVKQIQMNLYFLDYYKGKINGVKGKLTIQAIKKFQKDYELEVDGIVGKNTTEKMYNIITYFQKLYGAKVDGIAGNETIYKRENASLDWSNFKHFKKEEFTCKCGCGTNVTNLKIPEILEEIRQHFGNKFPIIITSGTRCFIHNKNVGGVAGSRHVFGKAVDFYVKNVNTKYVLEYTKQLVNEGKLRYTYTNNTNMNGVIHIDIN